MVRRVVFQNKKVLVALAVFLFMVTLQLQTTMDTGLQAMQAVMTRKNFYDWEKRETAAFQLRYTTSDEEIAGWIGDEADVAATEVAKYLPHAKTGKPWLVLAPDQVTIKQAFGWGEGTGALGVYQAQTIILLSPFAWVWEAPEERLVVFAAQNPLVHEYTHYVLDIRAKGNYPHWFSEGLASLLEYRITGYEWLEAGSSLEDQVFSYHDLNHNFNTLPNQALAYRQSLSMVSYLYELQGMEGLNNFIDLLGEGRAIDQALQQVYGMNQDSFFHAWQQWYPQDTRWREKK